MKFLDIPADHFSVRVASTDGLTLERHFPIASDTASVLHVAPSSTPGMFELSLSDAIVTVTPTSTALGRRLNSELGLGRAMLGELAELAPNGSAELRLAFFPGEVLEMGTVEIGVDEYVEKRCRTIDTRASRNVYGWLQDRCTFTCGDQSFYFVTVGPAVESALEEGPDETAAPRNRQSQEPLLIEGDSETEADNPSPAADEFRPHIEPTISNSFCVTGSDLRFVATRTSLPNGASILVTTKMTVRRKDPDKAVRLAVGQLRFLDWTQTGRIQLRAKAQLDILTADESSYLKKWDEFGDLEGEILLAQARDIGVLTFTDATPNRDETVSARVTEATPAALDALSSGQLKELEVVSATPEYLLNPELTFKEFAQALASNSASVSPDGRGQKTGERSQYLKVVHYDRETKIVTLKIENLPSAGTLVMSLAGERAQIKRRNSARRAILHGRAANPQLGLLIEEKGEITSLRSPQRVKPLTAFVREKVFKNPPTAMQERAIDVALNTPDIAVIQGPPGTGKTTVIAAILERLNEIAAKEGAKGQGHVLLSGFQHDAVENMINRISLNGIPVPKFGKRSDSDVDDLSAFERSLEEWCRQIAEDLRRKNPQIAELEEEAAIKDLYRQYLRTPTHQLASTLTESIAAVNAATLGDALSRRAENLSKRLSTEELLTSGQTRQRLAAQRIRARPKSFADDGPERAADALVDLEDVLDEHQSVLLNKASVWRIDRGAPPFLGDLAALKGALLAQLNPPPVFRVEKHIDEVLVLAELAIKQMRKKGLSSTDKKSAALAEFLAELESDPFGMVDAVAEFSYAFSATVQQSVNREMQRRKGISSTADDQGLEYEYVVIDEAARVSPRDLMIPMAQGKKIILVGDHRQLPHIIDEEVARRMEEGVGDSDESEWLKKSMFQYLFSERVKALEEKDGIQRRVTLDKQFRMHPQLGDFVSRCFYETFDRTERFESGLPAAQFGHHLPGTDNAPAIWLDVPRTVGAGRRSGTSWTRLAEAEAIARHLKEWVESPEGNELSYGVISFYKAQADLIRQELQSHLGSIAGDDRRIRVGTVDSFQGMEFDVVFLSIVRTLPQGWTPGDREPAKQARSLFGHLCLYNRLNVSMSRQKRLLVAVGDAALVQSDLAAEFIPGLVSFYELSANAKAGSAGPSDTRDAALRDREPLPRTPQESVEAAPSAALPRRDKVFRAFRRGPG